MTCHRNPSPSHKHRKRLYYCVRRVDFTLVCLTFTDLEVRFSVYTYRGTLQSAARVTFELAVC
jgi:hypothetical protein